MIRAVCFDMDGVLFDTERLGAQMRRASARSQGCLLTDAQAAQISTLTMRETRSLLHGWFPDHFDAPRFMADWYRLMLEAVHRDGLPFKPHVRETLSSLRRRGCTLALTSSNAPEMVEEYLRLSNLASCFDLVFHGGMVTRGKPDPQIYELALKAFCLAPDQAAGVEDAPSGVEAVRRAGMFSVMTPDMTPFSDALAPYVDRCIPDLSHLEYVLFGGEG